MQTNYNNDSNITSTKYKAIYNERTKETDLYYYDEEKQEFFKVDYN